MPITLSAVGTAEAIRSVQVRSLVTGQLTRVHFEEGQVVQEGQPLFTIDPQPFQVALDQARAVLARDQAQASNAQAQADRYRDLLQRGLIPRDQSEAQQAGATALAATVAADQAAVAAAQLNLSHTRISAPLTGRTGSLLVHQGDVIQANGSTAMVVINQVAPIYVSFAVPGNALPGIRRYQAAAPLVVTATMRESGTVETGRVTFVNNAVDTQTGTITLKGTFANADRGLWPGQFADVTLRLATEPRALVVPSLAVQMGQQGQYVYVVTGDSTADVRPVSVARVQGADSVIASGLTAGETVVVDGQLRLTSGARIRAREPVSAPAAAAAPAPPIRSGR